MAAAIGDILQITDVQTYLGQLMLNVYMYRVDELGSLVGYQEMADAFQSLVVTPVRGVQSTGVTHTQTVIRNLTNGIDIFEDAIDAAGVDGSVPLASFVGLSFRLVRSTGLTRHGAKRIGGLTESTVAGNNIDPTVQDEVDAIEAALGGTVNVDGAGDNDFVLTPVIVGRVPTGEPGAGDLDLSVVNDVAEAQFIRVSTQTTRRAGRGS